MIEAVGERYWPTYFAALDRLLTPDGRVGIQAIVLEHDRMVATRDSVHVDLQVHLPRRRVAVDAGDRRLRARAHQPADHRALPLRRPTTRGRCSAGGSGSTRTPTRSTRSASTTPSGACGTSTSRTARRASPPATSTSRSSFSNRGTDMSRRRHRRRRPSSGIVARRVGRRPARAAPRLGRQRGRAGRRPVVVLRSPAGAAPHRCGAPVSSGCARAYVTGDLDVEGDLDEGFRRVWAFARASAARRCSVGARDRLRRARSPRSRLGAIGPPPRPTGVRGADRPDGCTAAAGTGRPSPTTTTCRTTSTRSSSTSTWRTRARTGRRTRRA